MSHASTITRTHVLRHRVRVQQLDRALDPDREVTDATVLDLGVQETGTGGAAWSLANRGVPVSADPTTWSGALALAWTVRGAAHLYRRADLRHVEQALRPWSPDDAARRVYAARAPLLAAGIAVPDALAAVAVEMRRLVTDAMPKGELSTLLARAMPEPYLRWCAGCGATHLYELPFRLAALHAGLELEPGTSPPVLRRVRGWRDAQVGDLSPAPVPTGVAREGTAGRVDLVRAYLHVLGPAAPPQVAAFLDAPVAQVRARWPSDARELVLDGHPVWVLDADAGALLAAADTPLDPDGPHVRLLGPFDPYLQLRDRELLVADAAHRGDLWRTLGRPGAVVADGEVVGTWRAHASGRGLRLELDPWAPWGTPLTRAVQVEEQRLAEHRGLELRVGVA